jgi:enamine deaminase RidA (YjgF/YER057c/UK114 family)
MNQTDNCPYDEAGSVAVEILRNSDTDGMGLTVKRLRWKDVEAYQTVFSCGNEEQDIQLLISVRSPYLDYAGQLSQLVSLYRRLRRELGATTVFCRFFLSDAATQAPAVMNHLLDDRGYAASVLQQSPCNGTKVALWSYMKTGVESQAVGQDLYRVQGHGPAQLWCGGLTAAGSDSKAQATLILQQYVMDLLSHGLTLEANCQRTWFFVNDIDLNYAGMVRARNDVFATQNLTAATHYIASTGIGGRTSDPRSLVSMDAVAFEGVGKEQVRYLYASDRLNRTSDYGVSFERGTAIDLGDRLHVFISGTASIDNRGEVLYEGDVIRQAERMLGNVEALLGEAGCNIADNVEQALVYLRDPADACRVEQYLEEHYPLLPHLILHAPVCRPGWLIEMECMAVRPLTDRK